MKTEKVIEDKQFEFRNLNTVSKITFKILEGFFEMKQSYDEIFRNKIPQ